MLLKHTILPLFLGGLLYLLFRSTDLRMFDWVTIVGLEQTVQAMRGIASPYRSNIPDWVIYSLPNALWLYAFMIAIKLVWKDQVRMRWLWYSIPIFTGFVVEFLQAWHLIPGTFDPMDLALAAMAIGLSTRLKP